MRSAFVSVAAIFLLALVPITVFAKNASTGIYAVVDEVTFEPDGASPNLVRISGVFVVPTPMSSGHYETPRRGYLYFQIRRGMEQASRADWNKLKNTSGTGEVVGFAQYWVPNPDDPQGNPHHSLEVRVHTDNHPESPAIYPLPNLKGVITHGDKDDPNFDKIAAQLQNAMRR